MNKRMYFKQLASWVFE